MTYVILHAAWMVVAVAIGTVAGHMGLVRATQRAGGGTSILPGRFRVKVHVRFGTVYYVMVYAGILFGWLMHEFLLPHHVLPPNIAGVHIVLAILIAVLYGLGWAIGRGLRRRPAGAARTRPRLHMVCNFTACTLMTVQVALAIYYVWIWPNA